VANIGRPPCGEGVIRSGKASAPAAPTSGQGHRRGLRRRFPHGHVRRAGLAMMSAVAAAILIEGKGQAVRSAETRRTESETAPA
jgi:hypothetical protein